MHLDEQNTHWIFFGLVGRKNYPQQQRTAMESSPPSQHSLYSCYWWFLHNYLLLLSLLCANSIYLYCRNRAAKIKHVFGQPRAFRAWRMKQTREISRPTTNVAQVTCPSHRAIRWPRKNPTPTSFSRSKPTSDGDIRKKSPCTRLPPSIRHIYTCVK